MRLQLLLAARGGCTDELFTRLETEAKEAKAAYPAARVIALTQIDDDPFPGANPLGRPFEAVLELQIDAADDSDALVAAVRHVPERLADLIHADLSGVL